MTEEFESEVRDMCNLSKALVDQGIEQEKMSLAQMMIEEKEPVDKITKYTGYSIDKLKEIAAKVGTTLMIFICPIRFPGNWRECVGSQGVLPWLQYLRENCERSMGI